MARLILAMGLVSAASDVTRLLKNVLSWFVQIETFSPNFASLSFVIRVILLHPCFLMGYYHLLGVFLS